MILGSATINTGDRASYNLQGPQYSHEVKIGFYGVYIYGDRSGNEFNTFLIETELLND